VSLNHDSGDLVFLVGLQRLLEHLLCLRVQFVLIEAKVNVEGADMAARNRLRLILLAISRLACLSECPNGHTAVLHFCLLCFDGQIHLTLKINFDWNSHTQFSKLGLSCLGSFE